MQRRAYACPFNRKILPTWLGIAIAKPFYSPRIPFPIWFRTRYNYRPIPITREGDWKGSPEPMAERNLWIQRIKGPHEHRE